VMISLFAGLRRSVMLTKEQLSSRKIGGSDVSTILGLNPYQTPYELFLQKTGRMQPPDLSDKMSVFAGNLLEDNIAKMYSKRTGKKVVRRNKTIVNPKYDWITAHIDRDVTGEKRGLEIKNSGWRMMSDWGPEGSDSIPDYYLTQVHCYLLVMGYQVWDVAAYFGGGDFRLYEVERSSNFDEIIIDKTHDFWYDHVLKDIAPDIDYGAKSTGKVLSELYPGTDGTTTDLDQKLIHWHNIRQDALSKAREYESAAQCAKNHILDAMGDSSIGVMPDGTGYTRKFVTRKAFEVKESKYIDFRFSKQPCGRKAA